MPVEPACVKGAPELLVTVAPASTVSRPAPAIVPDTVVESAKATAPSTRRAPTLAGPVAPSPMRSVPSRTVTCPVGHVAPERVSVPLPALWSVPAPDTSPEMRKSSWLSIVSPVGMATALAMRLPGSLTVMNAEPAKVRASPPSEYPGEEKVIAAMLHGTSTTGV